MNYCVRAKNRRCCIQLARTVLPVVLLLAFAGINEAPAAELEAPAASASVRNPEASGPLHLYRDTASTNGKLTLYSLHGNLFNDDPAFIRKAATQMPLDSKSRQAESPHL